MKYVRINNNLVVEVIPEEATIPSVAYWYGDEFSTQCIVAPDEVENGWFFDAATGTFAALRPTPEPDLQADMAELLIDLAYRTTLLELGVSI